MLWERAHESPKMQFAHMDSTALVLDALGGNISSSKIRESGTRHISSCGRYLLSGVRCGIMKLFDRNVHSEDTSV